VVYLLHGSPASGYGKVGAVIHVGDVIYNADSLIPGGGSCIPAGNCSHLHFEVRQGTDTPYSSKPWDDINPESWLTGIACVAAAVTPDLASPQNAGSSITFSGSSLGCPNPQYRFWLKPPSVPDGNGGYTASQWAIVQDYGGSSIFNWSMSTPIDKPVSAGPGAWQVEVDVRDQSESSAYDAVGNGSYQLSGCRSVTLSAIPTAAQQAPGQVTFTADASGTCPLAPTFQFWAQPPGGPWGTVRVYGTSSSYVWGTVYGPVGTWHYQIYARDQGATDYYEATSSVMTYTLSTTSCSTPTINASPVSPGATGATITFTASTASCPDPQFRWWILKPGGSWVIVQDYGEGSGATYVWSSNPLLKVTTSWPGSFGIEVDVRDAAERNPYDAVRNITYQLNGCTGAGIATVPGSPANVGTSVYLYGGASCPGTPEYRFWVKAPNGTWQVARGYSTSYWFIWDTTGLATGTYGLEVDIRDQGSAPGSGASAYETTTNITYVLT
jgi:hypothetical protein